MRLAVFDGARFLGYCVADNAREDLLAQRIHGSGNCGFNYFFPEDINWQEVGDISLRVAGHLYPLWRCPKEEVGRFLPDKSRSPFGRVLHRKKLVLQQPVFFLHIPKTAGTSFNTFVQSHFAVDAITHIESYDPADYGRLARDYQFVAGHLNIKQCQRAFPLDRFSYLTLLREPFAHLHSHINWLRGIGARDGSDFYNTHHPVFQVIADQFGEKESLTHSDLQTLADSLHGVLAHIFDNCQTRYLVAGSKTLITPGDAEEALNNLRSFAQVGITEKFSDFQTTFLRMQQARIQVRGKDLNRAKFDALYDHRDPVTREILRPLVASDCVLYDEIAARLVR